MISNVNNNQYSVLMSVYQRERADNLRAAMNSIWAQTVKPDDFVLVCDGPLNEALDAVIEEMVLRYGNILQVIKLRENVGLGNALNVGIKKCKNDLVARMDSDDISRPDRCEKQLHVFQEYPDVSIVSGTVEEFITSTNHVEARRILPETQEEILAFSKKRNPFNHPCVMYRKSAVEASGGYRDFYLLEDYYLWVRMLQKGYIGCNIKEPLLWMRAGTEMYMRRSGWRYAQSQKALFRYMKDTGFISYGQYIKSVIIRDASSIVPNSIRESAFKALMRSRV